MGLAIENYKKTAFPGEHPASYGYYGNSGYRYSGSNQGEPYGPKFGTGDVIGMGITRYGDIYYTKNGFFLGKY